MECDECGQTWPLDRFNLAARGQVCYRCHLKSVDTSYFKYPQGRQEFKGATIKERQDRAISQARAAGLDPVPAWSQPYTGR